MCPVFIGAVCPPLLLEAVWFPTYFLEPRGPSPLFSWSRTVPRAAQEAGKATNEPPFFVGAPRSLGARSGLYRPSARQSIRPPVWSCVRQLGPPSLLTPLASLLTFLEVAQSLVRRGGKTPKNPPSARRSVRPPIKGRHRHELPNPGAGWSPLFSLEPRAPFFFPPGGRTLCRAAEKAERATERGFPHRPPRKGGQKLTQIPLLLAFLPRLPLSSTGRGSGSPRRCGGRRCPGG